jgi:hypothetical protein
MTEAIIEERFIENIFLSKRGHFLFIIIVVVVKNKLEKK